jgi:hypothetical protein
MPQKVRLKRRVHPQIAQITQMGCKAISKSVKSAKSADYDLLSLTAPSRRRWNPISTKASVHIKPNSAAA